MRVVADTDILSTFARIKRLDVLQKLELEKALMNNGELTIVQKNVLMEFLT